MPTLLRKRTRLKTQRDVTEFLREATGDEDLARFVADVVRQIGSLGYVDGKRGGSGKPYAVEYEPCKEDPRKADDVLAELDGLKQALKTATSDDERDRVERQIARPAGGFCTVWVNVMLSVDFERQSSLIKESFRKLKEAVPE